MKQRFVLLAAAGFGMSGCQQSGSPVSPTPSERGLLMAAQRGEAEVIPGQYIIIFNAGVRDPRGLSRQLVTAHGGLLRYTYTAAIKGFAAQLPADAIAALESNTNVAYIEQDQVARASDTQTNATWGLDRIDERSLPLDGNYVYDYTGTGVTAYIIDTGIRFDHVEFGGRATSGYDAVDGGTADDCNGHGTHVAGTTGGITYGVAKRVSLVAVRVLNCNGSGTYSGVIAGVDWVTANAARPAVANMSLGGGASTALDGAVRNSMASGVSYAIAAGNDGADACNYSPARVAEAMTVAATGKDDAKPWWSNWGNCVDWFAPGVSITSAWHTSSTATNTISGTSMATPHTAGVAALYLQHFPSASPQTVRDALHQMSTKSVVTSSLTTNNHLLHSFEGSGGTTNSPPTSSFTYRCSGLSCSFSDQSTDPDGSITAWSWDFGDGATSTTQNPSHVYATSGTYTVKLTVTDDKSATGSSSQSVTVSDGSSEITLAARGYKVKGLQKVDLSWSGAASASVDVFRNGVKITATANDGFHTDNVNQKGSGTYTYKVCEAGTSTCSNEATVVF